MQDSPPQTGRRHSRWLADASLPRYSVTLALLHKLLEAVRRHKGDLKFRKSETNNGTIASAAISGLHLTNCSIKGFCFARLSVANRVVAHDSTLPSRTSSAEIKGS